MPSKQICQCDNIPRESSKKLIVAFSYNPTVLRQRSWQNIVYLLDESKKQGLVISKFYQSASSRMIMFKRDDLD